MLSAFVDNALLFYGGVGSGKHFEKKQINRVDKLFRKDNNGEKPFFHSKPTGICTYKYFILVMIIGIDTLKNNGILLY